MDFQTVNSSSQTLGPISNNTTPTQKISSFTNQTNSQNTNIKSDNFAVDINHFSYLTPTKDINPNSRIITRNLSRKGSSQRSGEKKIMDSPSSTADSERDEASSILVPYSSSPRAGSMAGARTPEKPIVVTVGTTNSNTNNHQIHHHQITITTPAVTTADSKLRGKRFSFKRTSWHCTIDPRRIVLFFATLSSIGSILLIFLTLSMRKINEDDYPIY